MNNSFLTIEAVTLKTEKPVDVAPLLREREGELVEIIGAIQKVVRSKEWSTLKEKVFDGLTQTLEREIQGEARKENPDTNKLNRLAGQYKWAEKYSDLSKLEEVFRTQLTNVRTQLNGKKD